jgi:Zn-dependent peptidase ImmA (M78 family)
MHKQTGLHRDQPIDGGPRTKRDPVEKEADYFAACFLMPQKLLRAVFAQRFPAEVLNYEVLCHLLNRNHDSKTAQRLSNQNGLARALAELNSISGQQVLSLAEMFKVSREAMAIRLEELQLVPEIKF